jgi:hypothetical protein
VIRWFRTKRQLIADLDRQRDMLALKDEELREYDRALTALQDSFDRTRISREIADVIREDAAWKRRSDV